MPFTSDYLAVVTLVANMAHLLPKRRLRVQVSSPAQKGRFKALFSFWGFFGEVA